MRTIWVSLLLSLALVNYAEAGIISGDLTADDKHTTYISTSNLLDGDEVAASTELESIDSFSYALDAGTDYFLHIFAQDAGSMGAVLGQFFLTGGTHEFSNGETTIYTNNVDWTVRVNGWGGDNIATSYAFNDGQGAWTQLQGISESAQWIWNNNLNSQEHLYLTLAINALPINVAEPSSLAVMAIAILFICLRHRSRKSNKKAAK